MPEEHESEQPRKEKAESVGMIAMDGKTAKLLCSSGEDSKRRRKKDGEKKAGSGAARGGSSPGEGKASSSGAK